MRVDRVGIERETPAGILGYGCEINAAMAGLECILVVCLFSVWP